MYFDSESISSRRVCFHVLRHGETSFGFVSPGSMILDNMITKIGEEMFACNHITSTSVVHRFLDLCKCV